MMPNVDPIRSGSRLLALALAVAAIACADRASSTGPSLLASSLRAGAQDTSPPDTTPPDTTPPDTTPPDTTPPPDTSTLGLIHGLVFGVDSSRTPPVFAPLSGAIVTVGRGGRDTSGNRLRGAPPRAVTDQNGYYRIASLPRGVYTVRVVPRGGGFQPESRSGVFTGPLDSALTPFTTFVLVKH
jgi:hypothetical protein